MAEDNARNARRRPAVLRWLSAVEGFIGGLLVAMLFVLVLIQAAQRYLPTGGWVWTGELARFGLVWLTFAMAGYLAARDGHISLKLIDYVAKGRVLRLVGIFAHVMVAIVCLNLAYEAFDLAMRPSRQVSPAMGLPTNAFYFIPLAGLVLTTVRSIVSIFVPEPEGDDEQEPTDVAAEPEPESNDPRSDLIDAAGKERLA